MGIPQWNNLGCGEQEGGCPIVKKLLLQWHPTGGVAEKPAGYFCTKCLRDIQTEEFITKMQLQQKQREMDEIKESMATIGGPHASTGGNQVSRDHHQDGSKNTAGHSEREGH